MHYKDFKTSSDRLNFSESFEQDSIKDITKDDIWGAIGVCAICALLFIFM